MARAVTSGISLTKEDAALVKGMLYRGDRQHDIAAWFGVNGGRIAEISVRKRFADVIMKTDGLPPAGPYLSGRQSHEAKVALIELSKFAVRLLDTSNDGQIRVLKQQIDHIMEKL